MEKQLIEKFGDVINKAFFEKEDGLEFLRVEVDLSKLDDVATIAKKISSFLDGIDYSKKEYYLDVYSSGTEKPIDINELNKFIGENIYVLLKEKVKDKKDFEGEILEVEEKDFLIKWNAKGQFRKAKIEKINIEEIRISSKVKKGSK